ncbi:hypothetical protein BC749_1011180 [Flavobacterium araucananum]|jgi:hypothetical protein|uniref:Acid-shock protein n=1 Tax=Flavobacterium araucananum TaxID=946678 RepID=A0A227NLE9_9FLAO|nr:hypothetical protein [Flavobacterium araucananum]OXE97638.1 hypothetical protein B0A64_22985 [Flavobacterium araucananum]PWK03091.1 hypothetical protein BC749_1011180 [Flavobacterium araucananum]
MRNLLLLLVAVLGTSTMVNAFPVVVKVGPAKEIKAVPAKEVKATKHSKNKSGKKVKSEKSVAPKTEAPKVKK